jgi:hypothetical protein
LNFIPALLPHFDQSQEQNDLSQQAVIALCDFSGFADAPRTKVFYFSLFFIFCKSTKIL